MLVQNFFNECLSMMKTPEVITAALIFGIYFVDIKLISLIKRLCVTAVLLQISVLISHSLGYKLPFLKSGIFNNFLPRIIAFIILAVLIYAIMTFIAQKIRTLYKLLTD